MTVSILRGDARNIPLPDDSVDLILTSPPYFGLRDYKDRGRSLAGQLGAEPTPREYVAALLDCTAEWMRVLKPTGSLFVNLSDSYSGYTNGRGKPRSLNGTGRVLDAAQVPDGPVSAPLVYGVPNKSLMALPQRFMIGCIDQLGLICRAEIIWAKRNGMPESVTDRVRRAHEHLFHFTKEPRYYSAVDVIREEHTMRPQRRPGGHKTRQELGVLPAQTYSTSARDVPGQDGHQLGKLPGDVWWISTDPLNLPDRLAHAACCAGRKRAGCTDRLDHHAAFPLEIARLCIDGWSPAGICTACGQGRRPVCEPTGETGRRPGGGGTYRAMKPAGAKDTNLADAALRYRHITGYACACTPVDGDRAPVFTGWDPPPSRPALVLDPCGGTGTTAVAADVRGRDAVTLDLSGDYGRIAAWRTTDPATRARAACLDRPAPVPAGQMDLLDMLNPEAAR